MYTDHCMKQPLMLINLYAKGSNPDIGLRYQDVYIHRNII